MSKATLGLGFQATLNLVPTELQPFYGSRAPLGGMLFLRISPAPWPHAMSGAMPVTLDPDALQELSVDRDDHRARRHEHRRRHAAKENAPASEHAGARGMDALFFGIGTVLSRRAR